jgi:hypothetical protein
MSKSKTSKCHDKTNNTLRKQKPNTHESTNHHQIDCKVVEFIRGTTLSLSASHYVVSKDHTPNNNNPSLFISSKTHSFNEQSTRKHSIFRTNTSKQKGNTFTTPTKTSKLNTNHNGHCL